MITWGHQVGCIDSATHTCMLRKGGERIGASRRVIGADRLVDERCEAVVRAHDGQRESSGHEPREVARNRQRTACATGTPQIAAHEEEPVEADGEAPEKVQTQPAIAILNVLHRANAGHDAYALHQNRSHAMECHA